jgi:hypothetical protein
MFDIGQKVVCVDAAFPADIRDFLNALPLKGSIYTVRDIGPGIEFSGVETCAVFLEELTNLPNRHGIEPGFAPHRFREIEPGEAEALAWAEAEGIL